MKNLISVIKRISNYQLFLPILCLFLVLVMNLIQNRPSSV